MTNLEPIIEIDEYLDLSKFNLCTEEFKQNFHTIPDYEISVGHFSPDTSIENPYNCKNVMLRELKDKNDWKDWGLIDKEEKWKDTKLLDSFPQIKKFIYELPFKSIGRVFITFTEDGTNIAPHSDFTPNVQKPWRQEFLWFSLIGRKRMWTTNYENTLKFYKNGFMVKDNFEKTYSKGICCRFNPVLLHGVDCIENFSASIRVDGEYEEDFRYKIFGDTEWKTEYDFVDETHLRDRDDDRR